MTQIVTDSTPLFVGDSLTTGPVHLDLCSEAHTIVAGQTRSGKSVWLYSFLSQLAGMPWVRVVGVDFTDILLRPFKNRGFTDPWICTDGADVPGMVQALTEIKAEMDRRNRALGQSGADKIAEFSPSFPLIVVVLEEFPGIVQRCRMRDQALTDRKAPRLLPAFQSLVAALVAESAKAGIRLVLIAQRADADVIGGAARENVPVRIAFRQSSSEAYRMLYPDMETFERDAVAGQPPGVGVIETPRLLRQVFKGPFVTYPQFLRHVQSCDLDYLRNLGLDRAFREQVADDFPEIGDPG